MGPDGRSLSERSAAPRGIRIGAGACRVAACLALLVATPVTAKEVDGVARFVFTQEREEGLRKDRFGTTLDVRWDRLVLPTFSYRFSLRFTRFSREEFLDPFTRSTIRDRDVEPRLELRWTPSLVSLTAGYRHFERASRSEISGRSTRAENEIYARLATRLDSDLPQVTVDYNRQTLGTEAAGQNSLRDRIHGEVLYVRDTWRASAGRRRTSESSPGDAFDRIVDENLLAASFNRRLADGTVSVRAGYNLNDLTNRLRLPSQALVPVPRAVVQGFLARDLTPLDGTLAPEPGLVDGDRTVPTSANIGSGFQGGETHWNLGVELTLAEAVDQVDVWLDRAIPLDNALRYRFEVYQSSDNVNWTLVTALAGRDYDPFEGRFRLSFPSVTARFVKVVNTTVDDSLNDAVFVTEIEVFGRELRRGTSRSSSRTQNASASATWAPRPEFSTTLTGFGSRVDSTSPEGVSNRLSTTTGNLTMSYRPSNVFQGSVTALTSRRAAELGRTESDRSYGVTLTAIPVPDLTLSLASSQRRQRREGRHADTLSYIFRAAALLYRDLSVSAEFGAGHEERLDAPTRLRRSYAFTLDTRPREEIVLNTSYRRERLETPSLPGEAGVQNNITWTNRVLFRPSSVLTFATQAIYFRFPGRSGWSRTLQGDWLPFPGGALQFSFDYRKSEPLGGETRTTRSLRLRWNLNRRMYAEIAADRQRNDAVGQDALARTLLTAYLQATF